MLASSNSQTITYDEIGNPLNDGTWSYTWENGRQLASMTDGTTTWSYEYNADGLRTSRTDGTTTYKYVYNGGSLVQMTVGSNTLYFTSDTVTYNGVTYYYVKNLQGDVTAIVDGNGATIATYVYDAWGNLISDEPAANTIGHLNPIRYRGYVFDSESELYYLQSRYYDPELGRFLNADTLVSTGQDILGNNMFAYCNNNPVIYSDSEGTSATYADSKAQYIDYFGGPGGGAGGTVIGIYVLVELYDASVSLIQRLIEQYNANKSNAVSEASALLDYASTAAPPPPPNKGGKGTRVTSKTLYKKGGKNGFRIDVENPGTRDGQIHLQQGGNKYYYNVSNQTFHIGSSTGPLAPNAIQALLLLPEVIIAIAKGLIILGY